MIPERFTISRAVLRAAGTTFAAAAVMAVAPPDLSAQRRDAAARGVTGTNAVELSLRIAERLELTQEQRDRLESVRVGMLEQRARHSARMMRLQSDIRAGIRERGSVREQLAALREEAETGRKALRERYDGVLTDTQKQELRQLTRRAVWRRGVVRGRTGTDRWRGTRGRPGLNRGRGMPYRPTMGRGRGMSSRPGMDRGRGMPDRPGVDRGRGMPDRPGMDRGRGTRWRERVDRGRDTRWRERMDRGRGGDPSRGWRRPGGSGV